MKNLQIVVVFIMTLFATSCLKADPTCPFGMEGPDCETDTRQKLIGTWTAKDNWTDTYFPGIAKGNGPGELMLIGFAGIKTSGIVAELYKGKISFENHRINDTLSVSGTGVLNQNSDTLKINFSYTLVSPGSTRNCSGVWIEK